MPDTNPSVCYLVHPHPSLGTLTLSHGISASAWSRGISKPKKPTQGAPARAACTGKARLARRFAHESERGFGVYWAHRGTKGRSTRRRNRFLNGCLRFLTPAPFPPHARSFTQPGQSIFAGDLYSTSSPPPSGGGEGVVTPDFDKITVQTMP